MSLTGYRAALDNAWSVATAPMANEETRQLKVAMWLQIAEAERREPLNSKYQDKPTSYFEAPLKEGPGVVSSRCGVCKHFSDNHGGSGCRECQCEWPA